MRNGATLWFIVLLACSVLAGGASPQLRHSQGVSPAANDGSNPVGANHLVGETSPFLVEHSHNPIDWYPWGKTAFEKAQREQKPIFLSVGYYTCHWCHVMEQESFEDPQIAAILNRFFVSVLIDREQRPDVNRLYMAYVESATGGGGWPMNVFLTPDRKPFFGGTYFPPDDQYGRPGLRTILLRIAQAWKKNRSSILNSADRSDMALQEMFAAPAPDRNPLGPSVLDAAYQQIRPNYDATNGGFGGAPKFPGPALLDFLLRYYARTGNKQVLDMVLATLGAMARGGIHDQLGGGFHRYTTDAEWRLPHFEKMLYDQAQLALAYLHAYQITHDPFYAQITREILDFSLRNLRSPAGGFYSALDADSEIAPDNPNPDEGAFYLWRASEISGALGPHLAPVFDYRFGVEPGGNIPASEDFQGKFHSENVLYQAHSLAETAHHFDRLETETAREIEAAREKLLVARANRPRPPADRKIISAWNGMMISALAQASGALKEPRYLTAAVTTAQLLQAKLYNGKTGQLDRSLAEGHAAVPGFLDDYAFLVRGLLDLYEASFNIHWLRWAIALQQTQNQLFWDNQQGGYFDTAPSDSLILVRTRDGNDGDGPSGNSVSAMNLLRLAQISGRPEFETEAKGTLAAFGGQLESNPGAMLAMASSLDFELSKTKQIVIAGRTGAPDTRALTRLVYERFLPNKILLLADGAAGQAQLATWLPFLSGVHEMDGRATAYICEDYVCKLPTADPRLVGRLLDSGR